MCYTRLQNSWVAPSVLNSWVALSVPFRSVGGTFRSHLSFAPSVRWFQENDPANDELLGGVHFLSDPENRHDYSQLSIDLGTAPVESFEE